MGQARSDDQATSAAAGLSQERLAERGGLHRTYLSEIETSKVNPSVNVLRRIADALGVRASQLVAEAEDASKELWTRHGS